MSLNPFHAKEAAEQRSASDVFKNAASKPDSEFKSRFASGGKFDADQLEKGADLSERPQTDEPEADPEDRRSLYDRLQSQKDEKQEEWDKAHQFKNQMDHWRLDEDDAAFEEERQKKLREQQAESARLSEESAEFYKLARGAQEHAMREPSAARAPSAWEGKRKQPPKRTLPAFKVQRPGGASAPPAAAPAPAPAAGGLLGLGAYGSDDDSDGEG